MIYVKFCKKVYVTILKDSDAARNDTFLVVNTPFLSLVNGVYNLKPLIILFTSAVEQYWESFEDVLSRHGKILYHTKIYYAIYDFTFV